MTQSRFYLIGRNDGRKMYAPCYKVFAGHRAVRVMSAEERADYDAGYVNGKGSVTARDMIALGYDRD